MAIHKDLTGETAIHQSAYVQSTDPGAVGALKFWTDTTTTPAVLKVRNSGNTGWNVVGLAPADLLAHTGDATDAHDASAISVLDTAGNFTEDDVEGVLGELYDTVATGTPDASEAVKGKAELATQTETNTGTDDTRIVTPLKLAGRTSSETRTGVIEIATQTETDTGTDDTRAVTPLKAKTFGDARYVINSGGLGTTLDLDNLGDVAVPSPSDGDLLTFDSGTGDWVPVDRTTVVTDGGGGGGGGSRTLVTLGSDQSNSTTSLADVTGLSFAVTSGTTYRFYFLIIFSAQATTTGSRWTLAGPTATLLGYKVGWSNGAGSFFTDTQNNYNVGTATGNSTFTSGNMATIEGILLPSASGTLVARFASEAPGSNNQITAKAGSTVEWW